MVNTLNLRKRTEKAMAPHSSTLAWKIPWTEKPSGLQSMGWLSRTWLTDFTFTFHFPALEKEMETHSSVLAWRSPGMGEPGGLPSMGSHRVGHDWSNLAGAAAGHFNILNWLPPKLQSSSEPLLFFWVCLFRDIKPEKCRRVILVPHFLVWKS